MSRVLSGSPSAAGTYAPLLDSRREGVSDIIVSPLWPAGSSPA
jgi:hypothetical protein